ncbi:hypothetical protein EDEG_03698 [Edhazardia aedis USNM 41457]|uniref:Uncharacterized protein n=1 Tax=Edhazardia aedis (strain USNM 41457) TaxID=1003232 RepID=J8ZQ37_EDHAE|nr:hypothetical protein EDEG_03698 [Edhazardia aedis USNM 41457]|eukprot:EJW01808.1 hypothetical protein EDEG_03698 [Edhazardia aedis USNM 41457]
MNCPFKRYFTCFKSIIFFLTDSTIYNHFMEDKKFYPLKKLLCYLKYVFYLYSFMAKKLLIPIFIILSANHFHPIIFIHFVDAERPKRPKLMLITREIRHKRN